MFWLYILKNQETDRYYVGSTANLELRLKQHKNGYIRTTRILETYDLVYVEEYGTLVEARAREKKLKSYKSKRYLKWLIDNKRP